MTSRRGFLIGLGASLITAPAIVRAVSLMPVKPILWRTPDGWYHVSVARSTANLRMFINNEEVTITDVRFPHVKEIWDRTFNMDGMLKAAGVSEHQEATLSAWIKEVPSTVYDTDNRIAAIHTDFAKDKTAYISKPNVAFDEIHVSAPQMEFDLLKQPIHVEARKNWLEEA